MKIQIKSWKDGSVLFATDAESIGAAVAAAVAAKTNLRSANLSSADLRYADLRSADLRSADLSSADLRYADLRYADLRSADTSSADLSCANLAKLLSVRTIVPSGELTVWKKLRSGVICQLKVPTGAKRVGGLVGRKCRAEYAIVIGPAGASLYDGTNYIAGERVTPDSFDPNPLVECSHGVHFFITKEEAEAFEL